MDFTDIILGNKVMMKIYVSLHYECYWYKVNQYKMPHGRLICWDQTNSVTVFFFMNRMAGYTTRIKNNWVVYIYKSPSYKLQLIQLEAKLILNF